MLHTQRQMAEDERKNSGGGSSTASQLPPSTPPKPDHQQFSAQGHSQESHVLLSSKEESYSDGDGGKQFENSFKKQQQYRMQEQWNESYDEDMKWEHRSEKKQFSGSGSSSMMSGHGASASTVLRHPAASVSQGIIHAIKLHVDLCYSAYRGFLTRMVYLDYILRYTILVGNPWCISTIY